LYLIGYNSIHHHHHNQPTIVHCWTCCLSNCRHFARSWATRIQLPPAVLRKSSLHLHYVYWGSYITFTETRSPLNSQNSFTSAVVDSTADMASPLPLHNNNSFINSLFIIALHSLKKRKFLIIHDRVK
jgi:hypothetical protein